MLPCSASEQKTRETTHKIGVMANLQETGHSVFESRATRMIAVRGTLPPI